MDWVRGSTPDTANVVLANINVPSVQSLRGMTSAAYRVLRRQAAGETSSLVGDSLDLAGLVGGKSPVEAEQAIFELVAAEIAATLRIPLREVAATRAVREIGIDSLMAMELGMNFQQKTGFDLPLSNLPDSATVGDISRKLYRRVVSSTARRAHTADNDIVERLAARHASETGLASI